MRSRISAFLLALVLCAGLLPLQAMAADEVAAKTTQDNGHPYYIMVDRRQSVVTVYGLDENGYYTVPVRAMVCSAGSAEHMTPRVTCSIGSKFRWHLMIGDVYTQYLSQFYNGCLFHSLCYSKPDPTTMIRSAYNQLGAPASHGCVRLQTEDAKWIYDNCDTGTTVTIYDGYEPPELGKPAKMVDVMPAQNYAGWDPTDPTAGNPWADQRTEDIVLSTPSLRLTVGQVETIGVGRVPEATRYPTVMFRSADPAVALVDGAGRVRAVGVGRTEVIVTCGEVERRCAVIVTDEALPFCDVTADAWFYPSVRYLYEKQLISGGDDFTYAPEEPILRGEATQLFYNFAGRPAVAAGGAARAWYADAMDWAEREGLAAQGDASAALTKRELLMLLFRYDMRYYPDAPASAGAALAVRAAAEAPSAVPAQPAAEENISVEPDEDAAAEAWAFRIGLLQGDSEGALALDLPVTRAQAAALLHRYCLTRQY